MSIDSRTLILFSSLIWLLACTTSAQQEVTPPKRADDGPSLAVTMRFIEDKIEEQGEVLYVLTNSGTPGIITRVFYTITDASAHPVACTLRTVESIRFDIEVAEGAAYSEQGKIVTGDDLHRRQQEIITLSLKDVEKITVENTEHASNRQFAEQAHPEITVKITPPVFNLLLSTSKPLFSFHDTFTKGKQPSQVFEHNGKNDVYIFRDGETANRVAKAMIHAIELCGGGNKDPF